MRLLYFNPETEYALASGASFYTPPAIVERFRKQNQLLPEAYAMPGDIIIVDNPESMKSDFVLAGWNSLASLRHDRIEIRPWGWNHALLRRFEDSGIPREALPSVSEIDSIRSLAHRRTTIALNEKWNAMMPLSVNVDTPQELTDIEQCIDYWHRNPGCWLKAPWSSSGRGVINTGADLEERHIRPWCAGMIRRQGSVMAETNADRMADFASEWIMRSGEALFLGLSSFETSRRGKYIANHYMSQTELNRNFNSISRLDIYSVVSAQKKIIENVFVGYSGPLGVDMIVSSDGSIRPFVEVNLRLTMGMIRLESLRSLL